MSLTAFFTEHPVFTREEAEGCLAGAGSDRSPRTVDSLLAYHVRQGHLVRVRRGLYAAVPPGAANGRFAPDPHLVAAKAADDAVLAYHTALEFFGRAYSSFHTYWFLTEQSARAFNYGDAEYRPVALPKPLRTPRRRKFQVDEVSRAGMTLQVTSLERTLVDVFDRVDLGGGWEEAWRSLEMVEYFDLDAVVRYALALGNATTVAKVGYFLECHAKKLMVEPEQFRKLERARPKQPRYLDREASDNLLLSRWNLIVPRWVAEQHWEEPS